MLTVNKSKWYISNTVSANLAKPTFNLLYASPEGESKFLTQFEERTTNYWTGKTDIQWQHGGQGYIRTNGEVKLDAANDVMVKIRFDSPVLGAKNVAINASSKSADSGSKKLAFAMQSENGPKYSGT